MALLPLSEAALRDATTLSKKTQSVKNGITLPGIKSFRAIKETKNLLMNSSEHLVVEKVAWAHKRKLGKNIFFNHSYVNPRPKHNHEDLMHYTTPQYDPEIVIALSSIPSSLKSPKEVHKHLQKTLAEKSSIQIVDSDIQFSTRDKHNVKKRSTTSTTTSTSSSTALISTQTTAKIAFQSPDEALAAFYILHEASKANSQWKVSKCTTRDSEQGVWSDAVQSATILLSSGVENIKTKLKEGKENIKMNYRLPMMIWIDKGGPRVEIKYIILDPNEEFFDNGHSPVGNLGEISGGEHHVPQYSDRISDMLNAIENEHFTISEIEGLLIRLKLKFILGDHHLLWALLNIKQGGHYCDVFSNLSRSEFGERLTAQHYRLTLGDIERERKELETLLHALAEEPLTFSHSSPPPPLLLSLSLSLRTQRKAKENKKKQVPTPPNPKQTKNKRKQNV